MLAAPAQAAPPPLLGPHGPFWFGPITPATPAILAQGRGLVMVSPTDGGLWLEVTDAALSGPGPEAAVRRIHRGGRWHWSLDERLQEHRRGIVITDLSGEQAFSASSPLVEELDHWPEGTTLLADGVKARRLAQGWEVQDGEMTTLYTDQGLPSWRRDARGNTVVWERDHGQLTALVREGGQRLSLQFDAQGRPSVVGLPSGQEIFLEHVDGLLVRAGTPSRETRYTYDDKGRLKTLTWPDQSRVLVKWTEGEQVASLAGPGPRRTTYSWSDNGVEARADPGAATRLTWTERGYTLQDSAGAEVRVLTEEGRLQGWEDPSGATVQLARDAQGQITQMEGAHPWRLEWRNAGLSRLVDPAGAQWTLERTSSGEVQRVVDPDGRRLGLGWDTHGSLRSVEPGKTPFRFKHDGAGRLTEVQAASGARTLLSWSEDRLTAADPAGQEISLVGLGGGKTVLTSRLGESWVITRDAMGRPTRLQFPDGRVLVLLRNSLGRLGSLAADDKVEVRYSWRSDGRPTQLTDSLGAATGLNYDLAGRLSSLDRPDGSTLTASRDARGEIVALTRNEDQWPVTRDGRGLPTALGPLTWAWDLAGRWLGWAARGVTLILTRTGAGAIREVQWQEGERIRIDLDPAGRTSRVRTKAGSWSIERGPNGAVQTLSGPDSSTVKIAHDERGLPTLVTWGDKKRRVLRDAAGNPVKWTSSGGIVLSVDRDAGGHPSLGRFPSGTLSRWLRQPGSAALELLDPSGKLLLSRRISLDDRGRTARVTEGNQETVWRRDPLGEQVAVETPEGAWSWLPGRMEGPAGHVVLLDEADHLQVAVPPVGPTAWGLDPSRITYMLDEHGRIVGLSGDEGGLLGVEQDPDGHLRALVHEDGSRWRLTWDPFGRLVGFQDPEGLETRLGQGPEGLLGWSQDDQVTELLEVPGIGWVEATGKQYQEVLSDETGSPRIVSREGEDPRPVAWRPTGMPDRDPGTPLGWRGAWSLFPGGPQLDGAGVLDPVSGRRADPGWQPSWWPATEEASPWPALDDVATPWWDPGPWAPQSVWSDPLALLVAMGELDPVLDPDTLGLPTRVPPLPWLPAAAGLPDAPLTRRALGSSTPDPLVALVLEASVAPTAPLTSSAVLAAVLAPEWEGVPSLEGLVPRPTTWWTGGLDKWLNGP